MVEATNILADIVCELDNGRYADVPDGIASEIRSAAADHFGIRLEKVGPGRAVARMTVHEWQLNGNGTLHGGCAIVLADTVAGWATCTVHSGQFATIDLHATYTAPTRLTSVVIATATVIHRGRRILTVDVSLAEVVDATGKERLLARITCNQLLEGRTAQSLPFSSARAQIERPDGRR